MPRSALIVGNGEPPPRALLEEFAGFDLLLCADGGAHTALRYGLQPDYIIGDLDSLDAEASSAIPAKRLIAVDPEGDLGTDAQKVLDCAVELDVTAAVLLGFTGRRVDHLLWNLSLLKTYHHRLALRMIDAHCEIRLIDRRIRFHAALGQKLSLCPLAGPVEGISTTGLKWPLQAAVLAPGVRDGISNEVVAPLVEIEVGSGDLLLCVQRDSADGKIEILP